MALPEPLGASLPQGRYSSNPAGFQSSYHQRRGQAHLETNDETPETVIGAWRRDREIDRDGHRVSRFGVRPRAVRLVLAERGSRSR
jgi:hypothetical protein